MKSSNSTPLSSPLSSSSESETEELLMEQPVIINADVGSINKKRLLSKQLSMRETSREAKWEKRRRQILQKRRMMMMNKSSEQQGLLDHEEEELELEEVVVDEERRRVLSGKVMRSLTDEDLDELRGSIELGFGFNEEDGGYNLCDTLPALDLYFAVNRQLSDPKLRSSPSAASTPTATSSSSTIYCGTPSPRSPNEQQQPSPSAASSDSWKICNPGDNPQHVKMKLRHWAQAVACSVRQCC